MNKPIQYKRIIETCEYVETLSEIDAFIVEMHEKYPQFTIEEIRKEIVLEAEGGCDRDCDGDYCRHDSVHVEARFSFNELNPNFEKELGEYLAWLADEDKVAKEEKKREKNRIRLEAERNKIEAEMKFDKLQEAISEGKAVNAAAQMRKVLAAIETANNTLKKLGNK